MSTNAAPKRVGKARFSALSPTVVLKGGKPRLVLGAPGATYITMGNLQAMLNVITPY